LFRGGSKGSGKSGYVRPAGVRFVGFAHDVVPVRCVRNVVPCPAAARLPKAMAAESTGNPDRGTYSRIGKDFSGIR
jgi:hypothetical protein